MKKKKILFLGFAILVFLLSLGDLFSYYNAQYKLIANMRYYLKSFSPDTSIVLYGQKLTLKQPFFPTGGDSSDATERYFANYKFGSVSLGVVNDNENKIDWRDFAFYAVVHMSGFKDFCDVLYEYNVEGNPVYIFYDLEILSMIKDPEHGYETFLMAFIPDKKLVINIGNTHESYDYLFNFIKPYISDNPDVEPELVNRYYGGDLEWPEFQ